MREIIFFKWDPLRHKLYPLGLKLYVIVNELSLNLEKAYWMEQKIRDGPIFSFSKASKKYMLKKLDSPINLMSTFSIILDWVLREMDLIVRKMKKTNKIAVYAHLNG